ncbi:hypothetical protein AHAS_Ahas18G0124400 [Arachis hypogaea]
MATSSNPSPSMKEKKIVKEKPCMNLQIIAQDHNIIIEDPTTNAQKIFFPFTFDNQMHYFLSHLLSPSEIDQVLPFFPSFPDQELLIKKDMYMAPFDDHTKGF